ncbi:MAG: RsmB/NOP family class I SAM-dependent RNA methyltransferase [Clostridia bacterium]|nr:RsmB/NOP family class I SAM-dependent RNA methyltransferase [Clostridia bacterium]
MELPHKFKERMQRLMGDEYEDYLSSYNHKAYKALRINTLKTHVKPDVCSKPVPWCDSGYYYEAGSPGKDALHEAGAYYIQEPSAMSVITAAEIQDGETVLDLCAAPGGKSTQIACININGLTVSNEIIPSRAKILNQNTERMGIGNAAVTCASPRALADSWGAIFDTVVVDAPCSGEGMFRKLDVAVTEWSEDNVAACAARQREILECAKRLVKSGGKLIYSTCTYSQEENEDNIAAFLLDNGDFKQIATPLDSIQGIQRGINGLGYRLYPHKINGEGHYVAVLCKSGEKKDIRYPTLKPCVNDKDLKLYKDWADKNLINAPTCNNKSGDMLYYTPQNMPRMQGIKYLRLGLPLGTVAGGRFEPSHSLALHLKVSDAKNNLDLSSSSSQAAAYLHGESLPCESSGWTLVSVDGISLGWGKASDGILKNKYPKGLRK